jgi:hypothetical protein
MGVFAVYIEKEEAYFGGLRRFGNIYHFETSPGQIFDDDNIANTVAGLEKKITSNEVEFVAWRTWGPTDGPVIDSIIRDEGQLSGTGLAQATSSMYREVCFLVTWPLTRSALFNRKRWLRKFIRVPGVSSQSLVGGISSGTLPLTTALINEINTAYTAPINSIGTVDPLRLCTALGDVPTGPGTVRPYLYTRQIGQ